MIYSSFNTCFIVKIQMQLRQIKANESDCILKTSKKRQGCATVTNYSIYSFFFFEIKRQNSSMSYLKTHNLLQRSSMENFGTKSVKWKGNLQPQNIKSKMVLFLFQNLKIEQFHKPSKIQKIVFSKFMKLVIIISD